MLRTLINTMQSFSRFFTHEFIAQLGKKNKTLSQKALVLAPYLPPNTSGGVYRPLSWMKHAQKCDLSLEFITKKYSKSQTDAGIHLSNQINDDIVIHEILPFTGQVSFKFSFRVDGDFNGAIKALEVALNIYKKNPPSVIVATGPSFDYFVTGFYLSKILGVPLILDYRDEWTENPFSFVTLGNSDRFWEKRCLHHANAVIFTTESMRQHQVDKFKLTHKKTFVVANGWEENEHTNEILSTNTNNSEDLTLLFCGTLGEATPPGDFLTDIYQVKNEYNTEKFNFQIKFVGQQSKLALGQIGKSLIKDLVSVEGMLPRNKANHLMSQAGALLLFTNYDMKRYIPGKLFDYLNAGRKIIVHGEYGEAAKLVEELDAGYFVAKGDVVTLKVVLDKVKKTEMNDEEIKRRKIQLAKYSRKNLASDFFAIMNSVAKS
jgi:glycosyltransferase involved in cell wall biosynthesis